MLGEGWRTHQGVAQPIELPDDLLLRLMVGQRDLHTTSIPLRISVNNPMAMALKKARNAPIAIGKAQHDK